MKSFLLVALAWCLSLALQAQVSETVNVPAGGNLSAQLTTDEQSTITNLTLTGTIDNNDFATLKTMATSGNMQEIIAGVIAFKINCNNPYAYQFIGAPLYAVSFKWDFGDGNTATTQSPVHTFPPSPTNKDYMVKFVVFDATGKSDTATKIVKIRSKYVDLTVPTWGCANQPVLATSSQPLITGNNEYNYTWNFNDNTPIQQTIEGEATHIFNQRGNYRVFLTSVHENGCSDTISQSIQIFQPYALLTADKFGGNSGTSITFTDKSTPYINPLQTWEMNYGDETKNTTNTSPGTMAPHLYSAPNIYNAYIKVTDNKGCIDSSQVVISINDAPVITSIAPTSATENTEYSYTVVASDTGGDSLKYTISGAPEGMVLTNNIITWTPGYGITTSGKITLSVSDGSITTTQEFTIDVKAIFNGNGTDADPYRIYRYDELKLIKYHLGAPYRLMADIDASPSQTENSGEGWVPIGTKTNNFTGKFHGQGHVIRNLYINRPNEDYVGLFGYAAYGSVINDVGIAGDSIKGKATVGGLVGFSAFTSITACFNTGTVTGTGNDVGGLVGYSNHASVTACYNTGTVAGTGNYVGGLVGNNNGTSITTCYNTGTVIGTDYVGGLVGQNRNYSNITACYNTGTVAGNVDVGGMLGLNYDDSNVTACYSAGIVTGTKIVGGFFGIDLSYDKINECYYDQQISGRNNVGWGITGENTSKMKQEGTFNWNLINTWAFRSGSTYPALLALNNAPFAFRDTLTGITSIALSNLLANDYDYETLQTSLAYKIQQIYGTGTIDASSGSYTFPATSAYGYIDSVRYRAGELIATGDTLWGNEAKAVMIKTNTAPVAANDNLVTDEDVALTQPFTQLLQNDTDNDALSLATFVPGFPHHGILTTNSATSEFTYTPKPNWNGTDTLQYVVSDGLLSDTAFVVVTVNAVNDAPVISSSAPTSATEDVEYTYTIAASDVDNATFTYSLSNAPAGMAINGNTITWTPGANVATSGEVTLSVSDGLLSATEKFTITVTPQSIVLATLQTPEAVCAGSNLELSYTVLNGSPTEYQVIFGSEAQSAGFVNIAYSALPQSGNSISIPVPSDITDGAYSATLQVRNSLTESTAYLFSFTVNLSSAYLVYKFNDVILVDNASNRFTAYQWYKNGAAISGATNQYYNDLQGISGSYYAQVTTTAGETLQTCPATFSSASHAQEVSVTAYPNPLKTNSTVTVDIRGLSDEELGSAALSIYNGSGAMVFRTQSVTALNNFTLNGTDGIYIIYVSTADGKVYSRKITIIK